MIASAATMGDADRPLVLVIDDDDALRQICLDMLAARGYRTLGAASVGEGLRVFGEKRPAAVLLDLKLPDGTGLDVLRELQRRSPVDPGGGRLGLRQRHRRRRGHAARRGRVHREAGGPRAALRRARPGARADAGARGGRQEKGADGARYGMVGRSDAMQRVYQLVDMAAPTRARVLISGERGHRQGAGGAGDPRALAAARQALRADELRGDAGRADRERDVRPREGRLHRRRRRPARAPSRRRTAARSSWTRSAT